jgi:hypothetical protein
VLIGGKLSVKVVSERLGHTNTNHTLNTYTHLWPEDEDRTRTVIEAALRKTVLPQTQSTKASRKVVSKGAPTT